MTAHAAQALRAIRVELWRLAVVLCAAASLTLALGMVFPVQFVLDTAGYRHTEARTSAPVEADPDSGPALSRALSGERVALASTITTAAGTSTRAVPNVDLWVLSGDEPDFELTLMPSETRVAGGVRDPHDESDWIDINIDIARGLDLSPGDPVRLVTGPDTTADLTVRGVYAVRAMATDGLAQISARTASAHFPREATSPTQMLTTAAPTAVLEVLGSEPWRSWLLEGNYTEPFTAQAQDATLERAEEQAVAKLSLILAISAIAFLALLAIITGESVSILRVFRGRATLLIELGASARRVYRAVVVAVCTVILASLTVGSAIGAAAYATGFAGPVMPPSLAPVWVALTAAGVVVGLIAASFIALIHQRQASR